MIKSSCFIWLDIMHNKLIKDFCKNTRYVQITNYIGEQSKGRKKEFLKDVMYKNWIINIINVLKSCHHWGGWESRGN